MDRPGAEGAVLISHAVWRDRYHYDQKTIGRRVLLNGLPAVIVGVMPEHFAFPNNQRLWVPLAPLASRAPRTQRDLNVFARLAPGATFDTARAELSTKAAQLSRQYPGHERRLDRLAQDIAGGVHSGRCVAASSGS